MSTKTIKTRIGLKYDSYENWTAKGNWVDGVFTADANGTSTYDAGFIPNRGEVIFYEIPATASAVAQETAILFKVGDGTTNLNVLTWGSAIAADVYAWAKQQSLLGGTYTPGTEEGVAGTWTWSNANAYKQEQDEVAAFIKKETANIKIKVEQLTAGENIGKYQTYISNDGGTTWEATGKPFEIELTDYGAGNGISLDSSNNFSIKLNENEGNLYVDKNGLSAKVATVTYTAASKSEGTTTPANLTSTEGLLSATAVGEIKSYVDAKAGEVTNASDVTLSTQQTAEIGFLSTYVLKQGGAEVGKINIPKDFLVKSATLVENPEGQQEGKYIKFVINSKNDETGTGEELYLDVTDLCDVYTAENQTGYVTLAISDTNNITATAKTQFISSASGRTYNFTSYSAATDGTQYSTGKVEVVKVEDGKTYVKVIENTPDTGFVGNVYYVNSVFETDLPRERLQLNEGSAAIDVWVELTSYEGSDVDGLATALDVKRYVEGYVGEQLDANVPNVVGQEAITVTDTEGNTSKTVSLKLNDTEATTGENGETIPAHVSGLKQSNDGLEINDTITWILNCGGAGITDNTSGTDEA